MIQIYKDFIIMYILLIKINLMKFTKIIIFIWILLTSNQRTFAEENGYEKYLKHSYFPYLGYFEKNTIKLIDRSDRVWFYFQENTPYCKSYDAWGHLSSFHKRNKEGKWEAIFGMCTKKIFLWSNNFQDRSYALNSTFNHEAVHAAQYCYLPPKFQPFNINNGIFPQRIRDAIKHPIYSNNTNKDNIIEMEAFYLEDQPRKVKEFVSTFCY